MTRNQTAIIIIAIMCATAVALAFIGAWDETTDAAMEQCHALGGAYINHTCQDGPR